MSELNVDRRAIFGAAAAGLALSAAGAAQAQAPTYTPKPLGFDPKAVTGLSEKLLTSHHDNNYAGAVRRLGAIQGELGKLDPASAPGFMLNGLKREELLAWNSMILHELYFGGLGTPKAPGAALARAIEKDFGSEAKWRAEFVGTAKALGGGSGWVILSYSHRDKKLMNQWGADHTHALAGSTPILAIDMYEHAYHMDYGSNAGGYVDAVMKVLNWTQADGAFARAST